MESKSDALWLSTNWQSWIPEGTKQLPYYWQRLVAPRPGVKVMLTQNFLIIKPMLRRTYLRKLENCFFHFLSVINTEKVKSLPRRRQELTRLSYNITTMDNSSLAKPETSSAVILTYFSPKIPVSAPKGLTFFYCKCTRKCVKTTPKAQHFLFFLCAWT